MTDHEGLGAHSSPEEVNALFNSAEEGIQQSGREFKRLVHGQQIQWILIGVLGLLAGSAIFLAIQAGNSKTDEALANSFSAGQKAALARIRANEANIASLEAGKQQIRLVKCLTAATPKGLQKCLKLQPGAPGQPGAIGAPGQPGRPGSSIRGLQGLPGTPGPTGPPGPAGDTGQPGVDGKDGAAGLNGQPGADGAQGPKGEPGTAGADGKNGADGAVGPPGPQGPAGADGAPGPQGPPGADGAQGPPGPEGPQGPAGLACPAGFTPDSLQVLTPNNVLVTIFTCTPTP